MQIFRIGNGFPDGELGCDADGLRNRLIEKNCLRIDFRRPEQIPHLNIDFKLPRQAFVDFYNQLYRLLHFQRIDVFR